MEGSKEELEQFESRIGILESRLSSAESSIAVLESRLSSLSINQSNLSSRVAELERRLIIQPTPAPGSTTDRTADASDRSRRQFAEGNSVQGSRAPTGTDTANPKAVEPKAEEPATKAPKPA